MKEERVIIAGFGGQGIMFMGKLLCYAGMLKGKQVTYMPSYGAEVRGGTAYCNTTGSNAQQHQNNQTFLCDLNRTHFLFFADIENVLLNS